MRNTPLRRPGQPQPCPSAVALCPNLTPPYSKWYTVPPPTGTELSHSQTVPLCNPIFLLPRRVLQHRSDSSYRSLITGPSAHFCRERASPRAECASASQQLPASDPRPRSIAINRYVRRKALESFCVYPDLAVGGRMYRSGPLVRCVRCASRLVSPVFAAHDWLQSARKS